MDRNAATANGANGPIESTEEIPASITTEIAPVAVGAIKLLELAEGLYTLHVAATGDGTVKISDMTLPMTYLGIPSLGAGPDIEIVASYPRQGAWLGPEGGTAVLNSPPGGGQILVTRYVAADQVPEAIEIELHRLDRPEPVTGGATAQAA